MKKHPYPLGRWLGFVILAGASSLFVAQGSLIGQADPRHQARSQAQILVRGLAFAAHDAGLLQPQRAQAWLEGVQKGLPSDAKLAQAFLIAEKSGGMFAFLRQKIVTASLDPKRQGKPLQKGHPEDKALFDLSAEVESKSKGHASFLSLQELPSPPRLQAALAIQHNGRFLALALVRLPLPSVSSVPSTSQASPTNQPSPPSVLQHPSAPIFVSWLLASLLLGVFFFFLRGSMGHLAAILGLAAVAFYPYVREIDLRQKAWQDDVTRGQRLLSLMLRETPHATETWLPSILGPSTKAHAGKHGDVIAPVYRMKREGSSFKIELLALLSPVASASWPRYAWAGLLSLFVYVLLSGGWFGRWGRIFQTYAHAYIYIFPAMFGMLVLVFLPFLVGLGLSFFRHLGGGQYEFVGLQNFISILRDPLHPFPHPLNFYFTLLITILWTALNVSLHVTIGLALALLLKNPLLRLKAVYRVLLILPWAIPNYITALIWKGMFHQQFGAINTLLASVGLERVSWFSSTSTAFTANLLTNTWLGFPFMMVVSLGALQSIPSDLYEAADVDGASRWQKFVYITLPLLKPALFPSVILGSIWTFNMFNIIFLVSGGEPGGATDILITEAYRWAFQRGERYGYAAAYSTIIFLLLLAYSLVTNRLTKATEGIYQK